MVPRRRRSPLRVGAGVVSAWLALHAPAFAHDPRPGARWVGSWASAQQAPEPQNALGDADLTDATLREVVHLSVGGDRVRVRLSNAFGRAPLRVAHASLALAVRAGSPATRSNTGHELRFDGRADVLIPAGADWWSDPVLLPVGDGADLALSLYLPSAPEGQTSHPGARATSYLLHGDHVADADLPTAGRIEHWFFVSGVDVQGPARAALVALGDSITDGHGATTDGDDRWPDDLARRLHASGRALGVLNAGIGGNHLLIDGLGPSAVARFDRDVLAQSAVRVVILLEGINDIGALSRAAPDAPPQAHAELLQRLFAADAQLISRAREHGLRVIGATLTPFAGSAYYHPGAAAEADRRAFNAWIRVPGRFDAVVDFDGAVRDPRRPDRLRPVYDSGDHLHPSVAGYRAMGDAVSLRALGVGRTGRRLSARRAGPAAAAFCTTRACGRARARRAAGDVRPRG